jgi:hypothetical protein
LTSAGAAPGDARLADVVPGDELPELEHALRIIISSAQKRAVNVCGLAINLTRTGRVIVVPACG